MEPPNICRRVYKCSCGGCTFVTEDRGQLKACLRCRQALYCCRDHQVEHWKYGGHKQECYTPQENADHFTGLFCKGEDLSLDQSEVLWREMVDAIHRNKSKRTPTGIAYGFGIHEADGRPMVISDMCCPMERDVLESKLLLSDAPDLYLPSVPPALARRACEYMKSRQFAKVVDEKNEQLCVRLWKEFASGGIDFETWRQVLESFKTFRAHMKLVCYFSDEDINPHRQESLKALQESLRKIMWSLNVPNHHQQQQRENIGIPAEALEQGTTLIGKALKLTSGIEMVHITHPTIWFPRYTSAQQDWLNRHQDQPWEGTGEPCRMLPLFRSPVVAYYCRDEKWMLIRFNPSIHMPETLPHPAEEDNRRLNARDGDIIFLKVLIAAAEFGDVCAIYGSFFPAKMAAMALNQEDVFIEAVEKLLVRLKTQYGNEGRKHASYFEHHLGLMHEMLAASLARRGNLDDAHNAQLAAARSYYRSAEATHSFTPSRHIRAMRYNSLGLALTKLGDFATAKRAFLWATTDPLAWRSGNGSVNRTDREIPLRKSFRKLWEMEHMMTETERQQERMRALKADRSMTKKLFKSQQGKYLHSCSFCHKQLIQSRYKEAMCAMCHAPYCDVDCQRKHWPEHKTECKAKEEKIGRDCRKYLGTCSEETRALLSSIPWNDLTCTISLSEAARLADEFELPNFTRML